MNRNNVLLADEMGLGKTIQAIGTINNVPSIKKVLVLATASLKYNWQNELKKWLTKPLSIKIVDTPADYNNEDILICSYNRLANLLATFEHTFFDLIIADEVHLTKNKKTGREKPRAHFVKRH
jgi:SWI/SNF-related matrix-associated actin-dependent regulator 1 of chromatin subfamily A